MPGLKAAWVMTELDLKNGVSVPTAAALWQDEPALFEALRRRLASYAPNSQRAFAADWGQWKKWCELQRRRAFPAAPKDLVEYVLDHSPPFERDARGALVMKPAAEGSTIRRASTVSRWLASLSVLHRLANCADPTRNEDVRAARRSIARGRLSQEQKAPLHWSDVQRALATLGEDLRDLRAKALLAIAYSTLARRAELVALSVHDVTFTAGDEGRSRCEPRVAIIRSATSRRRRALLFGRGLRPQISVKGRYSDGWKVTDAWGIGRSIQRRWRASLSAWLPSLISIQRDR